MSEETKNETTQAAPEKPSSPTEKKQKMALWKKIAIGVVAFFVVVFAVAFFTTRGASQAGDEFMADLQAGNCAQIYDRTSTEFRETGTAEIWEEACQRISAILQGEPSQIGVEIVSNSGENQVSQVDYRVVGTDGESYVVAFQMVNRDGSWQLQAFDSDQE